MGAEVKRKEDPRLITGTSTYVTDIVLPDRVDGQELAREMQKQKPRLKIVYTSEYGLELGGKQADLREGVNLLQKPFQPLALARTVRCCLDDAGRT